MLLQPYHLVVLERRSQVDTGEQRASTCTRTADIIFKMNAPSCSPAEELEQLRKEQQRLTKVLESAQKEVLDLKQKIDTLTDLLKGNPMPPKQEEQASGPAPLPVPPRGCSVRPADGSGKPILEIHGGIDRFDRSVIDHLKQYYSIFCNDSDRDDCDDDEDFEPYYEDDDDVGARNTD